MSTKRIIVLESLVLLATVAGFLSIRRALTGVTCLGGEGVFRQKYAYDCGNAALQMVFASFEVTVSYEELLQALKTTTAGTSMLSLKHLAEAKGLRCEGWKLSPGDLREIPLPAILFLRKNHFVVLDGLVGSGDFLVRDPARGRLQIAPQKLQSIWGGEILLFRKPGNGSNQHDRWFRSFPSSKRSN